MNNLKPAGYWIENLGLSPHPEGGFYKELIFSKEQVTSNAMSYNYPGSRKLYTVIYYLLQDGEVSRFHQIMSDEIWFFHYGTSLIIYCINEQGEMHEKN